MSSINAVSTGFPGGSSWASRVLISIIVIEILALCLPGIWWLYFGVALLAIALLLALVCSVSYGRATAVIIGWMLIFPLGYYYASFPKLQPLFTLDRGLISLLLISACLVGGHSVQATPKELRKTAIWWVVFLGFAAISIPHAKSPLGGFRLLVDGFILPGLLAWFIIRFVNVREHLRAFHIVACLMSIYIAGIGVAEVVTQQDLLLLPESAVILAGNVNEDANQIWVRPNGPFSSTNSYALIGLVAFLFLLFLRRVLADGMPGWQKWLHRFGVSAALLTSFLPLFRSVLTSLVLMLVLDAFYSKGFRRLLRVGALCGFALIGFIMQVALPQIVADRTDPENVFGRIAEQRQIMTMFLDNPIGGVGLNNFYDAAQKGKYVAYYQGVQSVDYPHNNLGAILVETGLIGVVPFLASQLLLVVAFWKLCRPATADHADVWRYFLFIFLAYWVNGMSLASAYYSDLNLWYMLAISILYKYALTDGTSYMVPAIPRTD